MGIPSLSFRFVFVFSLSLAVTSSSSSRFLHRFSTSSSVKPSFSPKRVAADLISILGTKEQALKINAKEASDLRSCLRFLVPFSPVEKSESFSLRRDLFARYERRSPEFGWKDSKDNHENELVWWPPAPVMELARLAVDSCGDPSSIQRALDPTVLPIPDIEGSKEDRCELTRTPYGRRFVNEELNSYLAFLFEFIVARGPLVGLDVSLNRYDLFHGHLFLATESRRLGILFHAKEYPAYEKEFFPYNMGYCQRGSNVEYNDSMNLRNILWLAPLPSNSTKAWLAPGVLVVLDAHPGGIIYKDLVPEYINDVRTIYEEDFGEVVVDVNYLDAGNAVPADNIFIC